MHIINIVFEYLLIINVFVIHIIIFYWNQKDDCKKKKKNHESITYSNMDNLPKF